MATKGVPKPALLGEGTRVRFGIEAVDDAGLGEVVLGHLHLHPVAGREADKALAHLARDMGEDDVLAVVQLDAKHRAGQNGHHFAFDFDYIRCVIQCHVSPVIYTGR